MTKKERQAKIREIQELFIEYRRASEELNLLVWGLQALAENEKRLSGKEEKDGDEKGS